MPKFGYSFVEFSQPYVKASGREEDISPKASREICNAINGKMLQKAKIYLENVMEKKQVVAYKRYKNDVGHKAGLTGFHAGRYPIKAAEKILEILLNLENNGEFKGMDTERLKIIHAAAMRGRQIKSFTSRAFGKSSPSYNTLVHIELAAAEV